MLLDNDIDSVREARMDWLEDARREAYDGQHPHDMECSECGATWHGNWTRATRWQPAEPRNDTCPECDK